MQAASKVGEDIRPTGSDIQAGAQVLQKGDLIDAAEIGLLATVGAATLQVPSLSMPLACHKQSIPMIQLGLQAFRSTNKVHRGPHEDAPSSQSMLWHDVKPHVAAQRSALLKACYGTMSSHT